MTKFRGIATINITADDHKKAVDWYSELLNTAPYYEQPGYAEFRIGDYQTELGIVDSRFMPQLAYPDKPSGATVYWQVDDVESCLNELVSMGATQLEAIKNRGNGFITASLIDPFGNILGIMQNPHFLEILKSNVGALEA